MPEQRIINWAANPWNEEESEEQAFRRDYLNNQRREREQEQARRAQLLAMWGGGSQSTSQSQSLLGGSSAAGMAAMGASRAEQSLLYTICEFASMCIRANITVMEMVVDDRTYHHLASELQRGSYATRVDEARGLTRLCVNTAMGPVSIIAQSHKKVDQFDFDKYLEEVD